MESENSGSYSLNARDLHFFLEGKKDFSNWIKDRIEKYGFTENQDYVCSPILGSEGRGGQNRIDYHLTLDMAKELSWLNLIRRENNPDYTFPAMQENWQGNHPTSLHALEEKTFYETLFRFLFLYGLGKLSILSFPYIVECRLYPGQRTEPFIASAN